MGLNSLNDLQVSRSDFFTEKNLGLDSTGL